MKITKAFLLPAVIIFCTCGNNSLLPTQKQSIEDHIKFMQDTSRDFSDWLMLHSEEMRNDSAFENFNAYGKIVSIPNTWSLLEWDEESSQWVNYIHCDKGSPGIAVSSKFIYSWSGDGAESLYSIKRFNPSFNDSLFTRFEFEVTKIELDGREENETFSVVMTPMTERMADWAGVLWDGVYVKKGYLDSTPSVSEDCDDYDVPYDSL